MLHSLVYAAALVYAYPYLHRVYVEHCIHLFLDDNNKEGLYNLEQEAEMMKLIGEHKHIVQLLGVIHKPLAIVMQYCNEGNLKQFLITLKQQVYLYIVCILRLGGLRLIIH